MVEEESGYEEENKDEIESIEGWQQGDVVLTLKLKTRARELNRKTLRSFLKLSKSLKTGAN